MGGLVAPPGIVVRGDLLSEMRRGEGRGAAFEKGRAAEEACEGSCKLFSLYGVTKESTLIPAFCAAQSNPKISSSRAFQLGHGRPGTVSLSL